MCHHRPMSFVFYNAVTLNCGLSHAVHIDEVIVSGVLTVWLQSRSADPGKGSKRHSWPQEAQSG